MENVKPCLVLKRTVLYVLIAICLTLVFINVHTKDILSTRIAGHDKLFVPMPLRNSKPNVTGISDERDRYILSDIEVHEIKNVDGIKDTSVFNSDDDEGNAGWTKTIFNSSLVYPEAFKIHEKLYGGHGNETCEKRFPSCILLGVYKCGTRELMDFISVHPNILIKNDPYEFSFFVDKRYGTSNSSLATFRNAMPCIFKDQISFTKYAGYFSHPRTPERIYKFDKDMKMILMVREPVQRFISHVWFSRYSSYNFDRIDQLLTDNLKRTSIRSSRFPSRLTRPKTVFDGGIMHYLRYSEYDEPYERFMKYFDKNQMLVIESEEFKRDPYSVVYKIETFLELPHKIPKDAYVYNSEKKYHCLRSLDGAQVCYDTTRGKDYKKEINNVTLQRLREYFHPHNKKFFEKLGRRFDWNY